MIPRDASRWISVALAGLLLVATALRPADAVEVEWGAALYLFPVAALFWLFSRGGGVEVSERHTRLGRWFDGLVWATVAWMAIAAVGVRGEGNLRAAVNEAWWWASGGWILVGARQVMADCRVANRTTMLVVALATGLTVFAAHQQWISLPADRALFEADPDAFFARIGEDAPEGSPRRALWEGRLYEGGPTATFALANSLAGYLVVGILLALGQVARGIAGARAGEGNQGTWGPERPWLMVAVACVAAVACLMALVWTRSNAAVLGLVAGGVAVAGVWWAMRLGGWNLVRGGLIALLGGMAVATVVAASVPAVWEAAPRSLAFRFQYWRATLDMVADHPLLGAGPGNFQDRYPQYRLDEASEGIADPHNFLMETVASGGIPALLMVLGAAVVGCLIVSKGATENGTGKTVARGAMRCGSLLALAIAIRGWVVERTLPDPDATGLALLAIAAIGSGMLWAAGRGRFEGEKGRNVEPSAGWSGMPWLVGAMVAWSVHLCASGGWTVPGLAVLGALVGGMLVASPGEGPVAKATAGNGRSEGRGAGRSVSWPWVVRGAIVVVAIIVWAVTAWGPVQGAARLTMAGEEAYARGRLRAAEEAFAAAAETDPWDPRPVVRQSEALLWQVVRSPSLDAAPRERWEQAVDEAVRRNARAPLMRILRATQRLTVYQRFGTRALLEEAAEDLRRAVELAPGEVQVVAQLAVLEEALGDAVAADQGWARARFLAEAGGHAERSLEKVRVMPAQVLGSRVSAEGPVRVPAADLARDR